MVTITVTPIALTGTTETGAAAAGGGDACAPGDTTFIRVANAGSSITVTVDSATPSNYGGDEDVVVTVGGGATKLIGPLRAQRFAAATDGLVHWAYSGVTSVTVSAFSI